MTITKKVLLSNSSTDTRVNTQTLGSGNILPNWWDRAIKSESNKPDLVAITILSELWFLYRRSKGQEFNKGYNYFERKFGFTRAQLQEATLRLHSSDIAIRSFKTVVVHGLNFPNELYLKINLPKLLNLKSQYITSCSEEGSSDNTDGDFFYDDVLGKSHCDASEETEEHISKKEIKKYIGEDGDAIDKSWFSKLIVEEDEQNKSLTLKASSEFIKDWVQQNYNLLIEKSCSQFNYKHRFA